MEEKEVLGNGGEIAVSEFEAQLIRDQEIWPYYFFDGIAGNLETLDSTEFAEILKYDGSYICGFNALSAGEANNGVFFDKVHSLKFSDASGKIRLEIAHSTTNGIWETQISIDFNRNSILALSYDGIPLLYVNGSNIVLIQIQAPVGTITTDIGTDLLLGNNAADTNTFFGKRKFDIFWNRALSPAELEAFSTLPNREISYADKGAYNTIITSGSLEIFKRYKIVLYQTGDDFSNIGGTNETGNEFIATGTTPANWTNSSQLHQIGATLILKGKDYTNEIAKDSSGNLNHAIVNNLKLENISEQNTEITGTFTGSLVPFTSGTITLDSVNRIFAFSKRGSTVTITGSAQVASISSPVGDLEFTGLPYRCSSKSGLAERATFVCKFTKLAISPSGAIHTVIEANAASFWIRDGADSTAGQTFDFSNHITVDGNPYISGTFFTDE